MKAVFEDVPQHLLDWRRRTDADRRDEMWEGVLHMTPLPSREHQDFLSEVQFWIRENWAKPFGNRVHREINLASVGGWPRDFRGPDLVLLTPDRFHIDHDIYFEGPPLVVVEVHSPGDETYEKLDFYARLGVPEVWIIHRDTRKPTLFLLRRKEYAEQTPEDGWLVSPGTGIAMKARRPRKLCLQLGDDATTRGLLPE